MILEIRDGVAVGPLHEPVETGPGNLPTRFVDLEPLTWTSLCGARGYVYRRDGILAHDPSLKECFDCRVAVLTPKPKPKPTPAELRDRARAAKRRQRGSEPPVPTACPECDTVFTPSKYTRRNARRFCSKPCYFINHWRRKRQEMAA